MANETNFDRIKALKSEACVDAWTVKMEIGEPHVPCFISSPSFPTLMLLFRQEDIGN